MENVTSQLETCSCEGKTEENYSSFSLMFHFFVGFSANIIRWRLVRWKPTSLIQMTAETRLVPQKMFAEKQKNANLQTPDYVMKDVQLSKNCTSVK